MPPLSASPPTGTPSPILSASGTAPNFKFGKSLSRSGWCSWRAIQRTPRRSSTAGSIRPETVFEGMTVAAIAADTIDLTQGNLLLRLPVQDKPVTLRLPR